MSNDASQMLATFWPRITNEIRNKPLLMPKTGSKKDEPVQELPLARIKKIMKQDGDVKMISAEAPIMFSKAAEIFISELSLRAWIHTEDNKRRTLQRNDIAMAITKYDQFDFLIDIVPRDEVKPAKREESSRQQTNVMAPEQVQYYFQLSQLQQNATSAPPQPQVGQLPSDAHIIQQNGQVIIAAQPHQLAALAGTGAQIVQIQPSAGQQPATTQAETEATQTQQILQQNVAQTQQVMTANGQQVQYIRLPPGALQQGSNIAQVIQLQNLQQQQQQQANTTTVQSTTSSTASSETHPQEQPTYSQIYQPLQGLPPGAVYVMAQPPSSQGVTTTNQS